MPAASVTDCARCRWRCRSPTVVAEVAPRCLGHQLHQPGRHGNRGDARRGSVTGWSASATHRSGCSGGWRGPSTSSWADATSTTPGSTTSAGCDGCMSTARTCCRRCWPTPSCSGDRGGAAVRRGVAADAGRGAQRVPLVLVLPQRRGGRRAARPAETRGERLCASSEEFYAAPGPDERGSLVRRLGADPAGARGVVHGRQPRGHRCRRARRRRPRRRRLRPDGAGADARGRARRARPRWCSTSPTAGRLPYSTPTRWSRCPAGWTPPAGGRYPVGAARPRRSGLVAR